MSFTKRQLIRALARFEDDANITIAVPDEDTPMISRVYSLGLVQPDLGTVPGRVGIRLTVDWDPTREPAEEPDPSVQAPPYQVLTEGTDPGPHVR